MRERILQTLTGYVGSATDVRFDSTGQAHLSVRVAVNRRRKHDNEWTDAPTTWLDVTARGDLALNAAESLRPGLPVVIVGQLVTEAWSNNDGSTVERLRLRADEIGIALSERVIPDAIRPDEDAIRSGADTAPSPI